MADSLRFSSYTLDFIAEFTAPLTALVKQYPAFSNVEVYGTASHTLDFVEGRSPYILSHVNFSSYGVALEAGVNRERYRSALLRSICLYCYSSLEYYPRVRCRSCRVASTTPAVVSGLKNYAATLDELAKAYSHLGALDSLVAAGETLAFVSSLKELSLALP